MLTANQLRLLTSFKTALAVVIALGIAMKLNWQRPYWTGITVFITFLPYVGAAFEKSVLRVLGTVIAGLTAYAFTDWFEQDQVMMSIALFLFLVFAGYGAIGKTYPYFFLIGGITICIIMGQTVVNPGEIWDLVLYRTLEIALGVVVALIVNNLLFPQRASDALRYKVADALKECRSLLEIAIAHYQNGAPIPDDLEDRERALAARFPALMTLLQSALRDSSRLLHHQHAAEETIRETRQSFVAVVTSLRASGSDAPREFQKELGSELQDFIDAFLSDFSQLIDDLSANQPPRKLQASHEAREILERKVQALRHELITFKYPVEDTTNFFSFIGDLDSLRQSLIRLAQSDRIIFCDAEAEKLPDRIRLKPDLWRLDIKRLQHGIKVGIACLIALYAYLWLQWPSGVTAFLTCAIVMQVSITASNQKSMLRLGGCLLGGLFGAFTLAFVEPNFSTYYGYAIPLFGIFFLFSWINNGPLKYSYAGFQAQIAFLLMTSISAQQSVDLEAGFDRFFGILLGVFIAALVQRLIWPVLPEREFRRELGSFFQRASYFMRKQDRRIVREQTEPANRAQEIDLASIEYLPAKTLDWLGQIGFRDSEIKDKNALTQTYLHVQAISFALRGMAQANARQLHLDVLAKLRSELTTLDHALADALERCHTAFKDNKGFTPNNSLHDAVLALEKRLAHLTRVERATRELTAEELGGFLSLVRRYHELTSLVSTTEKEIAALNFSVLQRSEFF
ncbi:FUSC family protein [Cerasicoccus arenae]|uniref:FUSC family protein n=1 Tax=Cerasicoccus arenae TaxID=424488 RepID=A0A8J3GF62_9BACT|nr:FUSC family protein [Cerasicoccus arenae]MBK1857381.1 FUSC family protein [Cerasicoccus arenae]GHC09137.1 hypothetical protein GCM10007047_28020 [Cerasicoccus arenae]